MLEALSRMFSPGRAASRIALIDDSPTICKMIEAQVGKFRDPNREKLLIDVFDNGHTFFHNFHPKKYDLVLVDLNLEPGGMNGWEIINRIMEHKSGPVVVIATGDRAFKHDADEFDCILYKPYSLRDVLRAWDEYRWRIKKNWDELLFRKEEAAAKGLHAVAV